MIDLPIRKTEAYLVSARTLEDAWLDKSLPVLAEKKDGWICVKLLARGSKGRFAFFAEFLKTE